MGSDSSKGQDFEGSDPKRSSPPRPESSRPQTPDEPLQILELLEPDEVRLEPRRAPSPPLHLSSSWRASSPEYSDCSDGSMRSDRSKGLGADFKGSDPERSSPPRPESSRPQTPDEALQSMRHLKSHKVFQRPFPLSMPCLVEGLAPPRRSSVREILEVLEREEHEWKFPQCLEPRKVRLEPRRAPSPPCRSSVRAVYSRRRIRSMDDRNDFKGNHLSSNREPELSSGSSDSLDQSSKSSCADLLPKMSQCKDREGKDHFLLSGPHGIRDGLMSSNQDQPQSDSESSDCSDGSMKRNKSKDLVVDFKGRRSLQRKCTQRIRQWKNMDNSTLYGQHLKKDEADRELLEEREQKWEEREQKWEEYKQKWEEHKQKWEERTQKWEEYKQKWEERKQKSLELLEPDEVWLEGCIALSSPPLPSVSDVSPPVFSALPVLSLSSRLFRPVYSRSLSPPSPESSECSDVSMRSDLSKDVIINFSRKQKHELIFGSSDSLDQSSKRSCPDLLPDISLCEETEGIDQLFKLLLSGPHGIRDGLMSSNQDQPQSEAAPSSPGSSKTCDVLMKSDGSKGRADTDRKRRSGHRRRHRRGEKGQVKPGVRTHHRGHSQM